jgi:hypothetical protein
MSNANIDGKGEHRNPPGEHAASDRKLGLRLLRRMIDDGFQLEKRDGKIVLTRPGRGISLASGVPAAILAGLLESGALQLISRGRGRASFSVTQEGRAALRREDARDAPFAGQHQRIEERSIDLDGKQANVRVNTREDPLEVYRRGRHVAHLVGPAELEAGERLRRDMMSAQTAPQVTANWSRLVVDGAGYNPGLNIAESTVAAKKRVDAAMRAVGPDFSGILVDSLAFSKGLETLERENALPLRSGKVVLGLALRQLARHYGLANIATGKAAGKIRQWGANDYRPDLKAG